MNTRPDAPWDSYEAFCADDSDIPVCDTRPSPGRVVRRAAVQTAAPARKAEAGSEATAG